MADKIPVEPYRSQRTEGMAEWMVVVARPDPDSLADYDRAQKFQLLQENSAARRDELIAWLAGQGLTEQVARVGEPTTFNVLFVTATPSAAQRLAEAPGVLSVSQAGASEVDLSAPTQELPSTKQPAQPTTRKKSARTKRPR